MRQCDVARDVLREKEPLRAALARHISETAAPALGGAAGPDGFAANQNRPALLTAHQSFEEPIAPTIVEARNA